MYHREGGDTRRANNEETGRGEDIGSAAEVLRGDTLGSNPPYRPVGEGEDLAAVAAPGPEASHRQEVELKVQLWGAQTFRSMVEAQTFIVHTFRAVVTNAI